MLHLPAPSLHMLHFFLYTSVIVLSYYVLS